MKKNWYAVYTRPHCEKRVATLLAKKKIENFYPLNRMVNAQNNRKKITYQPLLSSFVFVNITDAEMELIRTTNCVINFVYWLAKPAVIKEEEITNLQYFTNEYANIKLEKTAVNPNLHSNITSEPLIDIHGKLFSVKNTNIKLWLPSLGYMMVAEVEKSNVDVFNYGFERSKMVS
jgi:transcription antitermination factor NusG